MGLLGEYRVLPDAVCCGELGEYDGLVGEYVGLVGEYVGLAGVYCGDVPANDGEVGE